MSYVSLKHYSGKLLLNKRGKSFITDREEFEDDTLTSRITKKRNILKITYFSWAHQKIDFARQIDTSRSGEMNADNSSRDLSTV